MASAHVRQAIKTKLLGVVTPALFIETGNEPQGPNKPDDWVAVDFPVTQETLITIGGTPEQIYRETGTFRVHCIARAGAGELTVLSRSEAIRDDFRGSHFDGIYCSSVSPAESGAWLDDGAYYAATLSVDFTYDKYV